MNNGDGLTLIRLEKLQELESERDKLRLRLAEKEVLVMRLQAAWEKATAERDSANRVNEKLKKELDWYRCLQG